MISTPDRHTEMHGLDSAGRAIAIGDTVLWRGEFYTIKSFGEANGRFGTRVLKFKEPLHITDEIPDEFAVDLVKGPR